MMEALLTRLPKPITLRSMAIYGRQCKLAAMHPAKVSDNPSDGGWRDEIVGSVPKLSRLVPSYASLLSRDIPCRLAHRSLAIKQLPLQLALLPAVHRMNERYQHSCNRLSSYHRAPATVSRGNTGAKDDHGTPKTTTTTHISDDIDLAGFTAALNEEMAHIERDHWSLISSMGKKVMEHEERNAIMDGEGVPSSVAQAFMDSSFQSLLSLRMLYNHHRFGTMLANGSTYEDAAHMFGQTIVQPCLLSSIVADTVEEARALCTEKFSVTPDVTIVNTNEHDPVILAIPSSIHHVCMELLKNSFRATIQRYGEGNVHEAAPVRITIYDNTPQTGLGIATNAATSQAAASAAQSNNREESVIDECNTGNGNGNNISSTNGNNGNGNGNGNAVSGNACGHDHNQDHDAHDVSLWNALRNQGGGYVGISITDEGTGLSQIERFRCWQYMYTTAPPQSDESGYGYSRRFGAPFTGHGVGLPTARQYTRSMGGDLVLRSAGTAMGTTAAATFERRGTTSCVL